MQIAYPSITWPNNRHEYGKVYARSGFHTSELGALPLLRSSRNISQLMIEYFSRIFAYGACFFAVEQLSG